jgi:hypothetical protein
MHVAWVNNSGSMDVSRAETQELVYMEYVLDISLLHLHTCFAHSVFHYTSLTQIKAV